MIITIIVTILTLVLQRDMFLDMYPSSCDYYLRTRTPNTTDYVYICVKCTRRPVLPAPTYLSSYNLFETKSFYVIRLCNYYYYIAYLSLSS